MKKISFLFLVIIISCAQPEVLETWQDGSPKTTAMHDGSHSWIQRFYEDGQLKEMGFEVENQKHGEWHFYFPNGKIQSIINFQEGAKNGDFQSFYKNGQRAEEGFFIQGKKEGEWNSWYNIGQLKSKNQFKAGIKNGTQVSFFENGKIESQDYFRNGKLMRKEQKELAIGGVSISQEFYGNGDVVRENGKKLNGKEHGAWEFFHYNGNLKATGIFKAGSKIGQWDYYFENGKKLASGKYLEKPNPKFKEQIREDLNYHLHYQFEDFLKIGKWTYWHSNGKKKAEIEYKIDGNQYISKMLWMSKKFRREFKRNKK